MKNVILAKSAGFCFGVKRAVDETLKIQKKTKKSIRLVPLFIMKP